MVSIELGVTFKTYLFFITLNVFQQSVWFNNVIGYSRPLNKYPEYKTEIIINKENIHNWDHGEEKNNIN